MGPIEKELRDSYDRVIRSRPKAVEALVEGQSESRLTTEELLSNIVIPSLVWEREVLFRLGAQIDKLGGSP